MRFVSFESPTLRWMGHPSWAWLAGKSALGVPAISRLFTISSGLLGLQGDATGFAGRAVEKAAPGVVFGSGDEATLDRVPVDVLNLLEGLGMGGDVSVIVAALPELLRLWSFEDPRGTLLEDLQESCDGCCPRLVSEEVHVLGHEDVGRDQETLLGPGVFEDLFEHVFGLGGGEERLAAVAAKRDEVELAELLEALEADRHCGWDSLPRFFGGPWLESCKVGQEGLRPTLRGEAAKDGAPREMWLGKGGLPARFG